MPSIYLSGATTDRDPMNTVGNRTLSAAKIFNVTFIAYSVMDNRWDCGIGTFEFNLSRLYSLTYQIPL